MSLDVWKRLAATPDLIAAVEASAGDALSIQKALRSRFNADLVRLGMTLVDLRKKAATKYQLASKMWFDSVRLEQSTNEIVAAHKAKRFLGEVVDLCCGLGADSLAFAANCNVTAVDLDPLCGFFVSQNAAAYGVAESVGFECREASLENGDAFVHIDPDRRASGSRVRRLEQYQPDLDFMQELTKSSRGGAIKVSAAANFGGKFPDCEIELVSLNGECKEATVWFGELASDAPWRATSLPSGESIAGDPLDAVADVVEPGTYLLDPDPAIVRSGLLDVFCEQFGLSRLDDAEEYLTAEHVPTTALSTAFKVVALTTNNDKQIRKMLTHHNIGSLEVKTRHVKVDANTLQRKYAGRNRTGQGDQPGVLFIARLQGKTHAVLCERVAQMG